jgi:protein-S-isoprenylcysteine O-methyltransferase Ste14
MKDARFRLGFAVQLLAASAIFVVMLVWPSQWGRMRWVGVSIGLLSLAGLFLARYQLGKSFAITPQAKKLVTHGLYAKIRNPIYMFSSLLVVGFALATQLRFALLILLVLIPVQLLRIRQEARVLEEKFGDEYREYRKKTWF